MSVNKLYLVRADDAASENADYFVIAESPESCEAFYHQHADAEGILDAFVDNIREILADVSGTPLGSLQPGVVAWETFPTVG